MVPPMQSFSVPEVLEASLLQLGQHGLKLGENYLQETWGWVVGVSHSALSVLSVSVCETELKWACWSWQRIKQREVSVRELTIQIHCLWQSFLPEPKTGLLPSETVLSQEPSAGELYTSHSSVPFCRASSFILIDVWLHLMDLEDRERPCSPKCGLK